MTDERDFDRLARAWLELGPDEAPDRVIAAVHHAVEATPQVRQSRRWPSWRFSSVTRLPLAAGAAAVLVVLIGGAAILNQRDGTTAGGPSPSPSAAPSPSPSPSAPSPSPAVSPPPATPSKVIVLQRAPANLGCDAIGIDYDIATIHIDPDAATQVWAEANDGTRLATFWSAGFTATNTGSPTIVGPTGNTVAVDGTRIDVRSWQTQAPWKDYFLCPSTTAIYVLEQAPS